MGGGERLSVPWLWVGGGETECAIKLIEIIKHQQKDNMNLAIKQIYSQLL